ncbi:hypothetical protein MG293_001818 [Ovis ammon polii]|uniref:Uncharacterized protein n=1 Tax=Ovis ammon polii TaxID=230172 RepID=A0AAD4UN44_OVIAM|nr:hypothetical protein MG293_001818 [Ovis ammon polii]
METFPVHNQAEQVCRGGSTRGLSEQPVLAVSHQILDFPGGIEDGNPPTSAEDTGSIPGLGRSHMPRSHKDRVPQVTEAISKWRARASISGNEEGNDIGSKFTDSENLFLVASGLSCSMRGLHCGVQSAQDP